MSLPLYGIKVTSTVWLTSAMLSSTLPYQPLQVAVEAKASPVVAAFPVAAVVEGVAEAGSFIYLFA
jgi:hypothetical protein